MNGKMHNAIAPYVFPHPHSWVGENPNVVMCLDCGARIKDYRDVDHAVDSRCLRGGTPTAHRDLCVHFIDTFATSCLVCRYSIGRDRWLTAEEAEALFESHPGDSDIHIHRLKVPHRP